MVPPGESSQGGPRRRFSFGRRRGPVVVIAVACLLAVLGVVLAVVSGNSHPRSKRSSGAANNSGSGGHIAPGTRLAFAHYFTPFPLGNGQPPDRDYYARQLLTVGGEQGRHAAYGGYLRDRPAPRDPAAGDWMDADLRTEVRQARAAGLDGFTLDLLSAKPSSLNYFRVTRLLAAAHQVDPQFKIMLMPDMASLANADPDTIVRLIGTFGSAPAAFRLGDGRLVVSPFKAEAHPPSWWSAVFTQLHDRYGISVAFVPTFLDWKSNVAAFRSISYGFSSWGQRNPEANADAADAAREAHSMGRLWMQPISVQDERPNQGIFDEADNTENLRATWQGAIDGNADWVQLVTWNDYSEGTAFAPSAEHGWTFLNLSHLFLTQWKTGTFPAVSQDELYLTHRTQFASSRPSYPETKLMQLRPGGSPARDDVEVVSVLTAPATVTLTVGGRSYAFDAPAGLSAHDAPLAVGPIGATVTRDGQTTATVTSPFPVTETPKVQDLQYVGVTNVPSPALPPDLPSDAAALGQ